MTDTKEIFEEARTNSVWLARPLPDELLRRVRETVPERRRAAVS